MVGRKPQHESAGKRIVRREYGGDQAPSAAARERDRVRRVLEGNYRGHRSERLHFVDRMRGVRLAAQQQERWQERAAFGVAILDLERMRIAEDEIGLATQFGEPRKHLAALYETDQGSHANTFAARIADEDLAQRALERGDGVVRECGWNERFADGGTLLPRLDRHLAGDLLDERVEFGRAGRRIGRQNTRVQRIGFRNERYRVPNDPRVHTQPRGRVRGACKGNRNPDTSNGRTDCPSCRTRAAVRPRAKCPTR